jgi:glycerophosphodiester phosphodiesterase
MMNLLKAAKEKKVLLVAHRGVCGGNIPCNSLQAFRAAINQGADIAELDVDRSADGELFIQHPGMERVHLRIPHSIRNYNSAELQEFRLSNCDLAPTEWSIVRLEEALELLRGKCIVNIDKFWENPEAIAKLVRRLKMEDQILIKTENRPEYLNDVETYAPDIPYMTIANTEDTTHEAMMKRSINYVGTEVLFETEDAPVASAEYLNQMHHDGKIVWSNAIVYNYRAVLSAHHNDDISLTEDPTKGWGWLADHGFDLIQTDFLFPCKHFLETTGRRTVG